MEGYIRKLLNYLLRMCEENLEGLNHLFEVFKNVFLLSKNALFEVMFAKGCLQCNPNAKVRKKHHDYLRQMPKFKEVISITNPEHLAKIHQTYSVHYIQVWVLKKLNLFIFEI